MRPEFGLNHEDVLFLREMFDPDDVLLVRGLMSSEELALAKSFRERMDRYIAWVAELDEVEERRLIDKRVVREGDVDVMLSQWMVYNTSTHKSEIRMKAERIESDEEVWRLEEPEPDVCDKCGRDIGNQELTVHTDPGIICVDCNEGKPLAEVWL